MGIDLLDLFFRIERVFKIKIDRTEIDNLMASAASNGAKRDIRVRDLVTWIESQVRAKHPEYDGDVFEQTRPEIASCLYVNESEVTPDAWMVKDLGME